MRALLPEVNLLTFIFDSVLASFPYLAAGQFIRHTNCIALADDNQAFGLGTFPLDVLSLPIFLLYEVGN